MPLRNIAGALLLALGVQHAYAAPVKGVAVSRQNLDGVAIVLLEISPVHSIADRKGKIVAVWRGARSQQPVLRALEHAGLPRDSVPDAVDATTAVANSSFRRSANASPSWIARS